MGDAFGKTKWGRDELTEFAGISLVLWYLLTPPSMPNGQSDLAARLQLWERQQVFVSRDECSNDRKRLLDLQAAPGTNERALADMKTVLEASQCVADDDPRLKQK